MHETIEELISVIDRCIELVPNNIGKEKEIRDSLEKEIERNKYNKSIEKKYSTFIKNEDFSDLDIQLKNLFKYLKEKKNLLQEQYENYNDVYKNYICKKYNLLEKNLKSNVIVNKDYYNFVDGYKEFKQYITNIKCDDILCWFSKEHQKYILFGKNGVGKTKLLQFLKKEYLVDASYYIPSNRCIEYTDNGNITDRQYREKTLGNLFFESYDIDKINIFLINLLKNRDYLELQSEEILQNDIKGKRVGNTVKTITDIFNSLDLNRNVYIDINDRKVYLYKDINHMYSIENGSDGEKSIFQLITYCMLCEKNAFIFIDEPETHLNGAILKDLFNLIENKRKDLVFIYCTHNMDFIESKLDCQLVLLKNYDGVNWDAEYILSYEDIPVSVVSNIVGAKKNILFIEGDAQKSKDYKFYEVLFDKYKIIPCNSCEDAMKFCKTVNNLRISGRKAIAVIDKDYREHEEINVLNKDNIYTLKYNEIENMLIRQDILEKIIIATNQEKEIINKVKESIFKELEKNNVKNGIIQNYTNTIYSRMLEKPKIKVDDIESIKSQINECSANNMNKVMKKIETFINECDICVKNRKYEEILKLVSDKGLYAIVCRILGVKKEVFYNMAIGSIREDEVLKKKIRDEIMNDTSK